MNRDDLIKGLNGERPERIPLISAGIQIQREIERLTLPDCNDENTYIYHG